VDAQVEELVHTHESPTRNLSGIWKNIRTNYQLHLIVLVPVSYMIIFHYIPMYGVQIAFRNFVATKGFFGSDWVGLKHFIRFFNSPLAGRIIANTFVLSIYQLLAGFPIPIILALALNNTRLPRFKKTVQMVTYAPFFISMVVLVGMMYQFFSTKYGAANFLIKAVGGDPILFMGRADLFRHMFVWSGVWQRAGWGTIIYLSALSTVDPNLHEAALMDGASRLRRVFHIDIPVILPTIIVLLILNVGRIMTIGFEKVLLMQNATNLQTSEIIQTYVYKIGLASNIPNFSYAAAIGLFNSLVNFTLLIIVNRVSRRITETSLW
jgi:ABC-type polysaccharide transport system permease subunit